MDVTREEVKRIVDFLRENPGMAREFSVVINTGIVERIDSFEKVMERHFEESSARFAALDAKFNELIREMHANAEAASKKFEEHDRKFDAIIKEMHEGFEQARMEREKGFEEARKEREEGFAAANRRFEEHDRKFDAVIREMHEGFEEARREREKGFEEARKEREAGFAAVNKQIGSIGSTLGRLIEDRLGDKTEAYAERHGWTVSRRIQADGEEIDFLIKNGVRLLIEVKSHADMASLDQVVRKSKKLKTRGVLVGERVDRGVVREAGRRKILCLSLYEFDKWLKQGGPEKFYSKRG